VRELKPAKVSLQIRLNLHWPGPLRTLADKANIILSAGACLAPSAVSHVDISLYNRDAMVVKAEVALYLQVHTPSIRYLRLFTPSKNCLSIDTYGIPDSDPELIHKVRLCDRLEKITWLNDQLYSSFPVGKTVWLDYLLISLASLAPTLCNMIKGYPAVIDLL
jgi:hypothetical protein